MPTAQAQVSQKFRLHKTTNGELSVFTLQGVIDEGFEGRKVAESVRTKKLVLNMREVRRFASWGMAEWMDFVRGNAERDLYIVECSTQALNQFSLVTGLLGHAKLVSFYVPYRCGHCGEEFSNLLLIPLDRSGLRDIAESEHPCGTCGAAARVDRYVAAMCEAIAARPAYDIDDEVVAFFRGQLKYNVTPDVNRFRAYRRIEKGYTYLRLSGNISGLADDALAKGSEGTTVVDLAGINVQTFDQQSLAPWRKYVEGALQKVQSLQVLDCPPGFLERAVAPEDLLKLKVRTFALHYHCATCNVTMPGIVDVAPNLEFLVEGRVPALICSTCKSQLMPSVTPELAAVLQRLPAREHDTALDKFLNKARREPVDKLDDGLVARPQKPAKPTGISRVVYIAIGLMLLLTAGVIVIGVGVWNQRSTTAPPVTNALPPPPKQPQTFQRPDWIVSDQPGSAFCQESLNRLVCVGVSAYRTTRDEAVADANDAALEELINTVGLKINNAFFKENVLAAYSDTRTKALAALQDIDRSSTQFPGVDKTVREARKRAVEILRASGGPVVPAQRSDWYWEEYAVEKGPGVTETLVFVRYDLNSDALKALVDKYSAPASVAESTVITTFPGMAWKRPDITSGVMFAKVGRSLASQGLAPRDLVLALDDQPVTDAVTFAKRFDEALHKSEGAAKLSVKSGDTPPKVVELKRR